MTACTAISAFFPSIVSKSIFAPRRADKSFESENMPAGILNAGVAAIQLSKLAEGVAGIATENTAKQAKLATSSVQGLASESIFSDINKVTNNITKHISINGLIGLATLANALSAEDKETALIQNAGMYGGMLAFEGAHKMLFGSSNSIHINGENKIEIKEGLLQKHSELYRNKAKSINMFLEKQEEALKDSGAVKKAVGKMLKYVPGAAKGLSFAGMSIGGSLLCYNLSGNVAEKITGRKKAKFISLTQKNVNNNKIEEAA